jgi:hypothetical protein
VKPYLSAAPLSAARNDSGDQVQALLITDNANLDEIDEALTYAQQLPADQRGQGWHAFTDRLLEMRAALKNTGAITNPPYRANNPGQSPGQN